MEEQKKERDKVKTYYCSFDAARLGGIDRMTLERWRKRGHVTPSVVVQLGHGRICYGWSEEDVRAIKRFGGLDNHSRPKESKGHGR
jgi:hypothetical protein